MKLLSIGGTQQSFANHVTSNILNKLRVEKPQHWEVMQRNLDGNMHDLNLSYSIHRKWWGIAKNINYGLNSYLQFLGYLLKLIIEIWQNKA
jgi:hypothetical protein